MLQHASGQIIESDRVKSERRERVTKKARGPSLKNGHVLN